MKSITLVLIAGLLIVLCYFGGCNYSNVPNIKAHAQETLLKNGYTITGYEGYQLGGFETPGGRVWYIFQQTQGNHLTYEGCITKWGAEYHLYHFRAIDAISPSR